MELFVSKLINELIKKPYDYDYIKKEINKISNNNNNTINTNKNNTINNKKKKNRFLKK